MKKYLILLITGIIAIPISSIIPMKGQAIWFPQYVAMLFMLFAGISLLLWNFNKYLSIFTFIVLISAFFNTGLKPRAIMCLLQFDLCCLAAYGISKFNQQQRKYILYSILSLVVIYSIWILLQSYNKDPFFSSTLAQGKDELVGFSGAKDQLGTFFALTMPVMAFLNPAFLTLSFMGLLISKSSFAIVSAISGLGLYYFCVSKRIFYISLLGIAMILIIFFRFVDPPIYQDFEIRLNVWKCAVVSTIKGELTVTTGVVRQDTRNGVFSTVEGETTPIKFSPIIGMGLGSWISSFPYVKAVNFNYYDEKFTHAHNDFVEMFLELGWLGLISLVLLMMNMAIRFLKAVKTRELVLFASCILVYALNASGNFLSHLAVSGMLLTVFYGCFEGVLRDGKITQAMQRA